MDDRDKVTHFIIQSNQYFLSLIQQLFVESSSESSDDETEIIAVMTTLTYNTHPRERDIPRCENYYERTVPRYLQSEFQSHFRMTPDAFRTLCRLVIPRLRKQHPNGGRPLENPEKKLLAVIWLLATPDSYRSVGEKFNLGKASISDAFIQIIKVLTDVAAMIIKWPSQEEKEEIIRKFRAFGGIDKVVGAVDGTYVPIKAPKDNSHVYITRKHNYAMTLQCIAEPSLKFIDAYIAYPGSVSDTRIFRNSDIYQTVTANPADFFDNEFILGDKAYPLLEWCIPPYIERRRLTPEQRNFNKRHAETRQVIERSFALLFGRFRRLKYLDMNRIDLIPATVVACCVLHNICLSHVDLLIEEYIQQGNEFINENNNDERDEIGFPNENNLAARQLRDNICITLYNRRRNVNN